VSERGRQNGASGADVIRLRAALVGMLNATDAYMTEPGVACVFDGWDGSERCPGPSPETGMCPHGEKVHHTPRRRALITARQLATDVALMYDEDGGRRHV
jgi:hypothetical protein